MKKIPNILTTMRMVLVLALIAFSALAFNQELQFKELYKGFTGADLVVLIIFTTASVTDFFDGYLARKWNAQSNFGKLLDPIADKMLVSVMLILMLFLGRIPFAVVALFICRDIAVDGLRMLALQSNIIIAAAFAGKAKTFLQMTALIVISLNFSTLAGQILIYLALAVALISMVEYYYRFFKRGKNA